MGGTSSKGTNGKDKTVESQMKWLRKELRLRTEIARVVANNMAADELIDNILLVLAEGFGASGGAVYFMDQEHSTLSVKATWGLAPEYAEKYQRIHLGTNVTGRVAETGEGMIIRDSSVDQRSTENVVKILSYRSAVVTPVTSEGEVIGIIALISEDREHFNDNDLKLMEFISDHTSLVIANAILNQQIAMEREMTLDILDSVDEGIYDARVDPLEDADGVDDLLEKCVFRTLNQSFSRQSMNGLAPGHRLSAGFEGKFLRKALESAISDGEFVGIERKWFGEEERLFEVKALGVYEDDRFIGIKGTRAEVTDRLKMEEKLDQNKRDSELFMDHLTHDISNVNTAVLGFLELMSNKNDLPEDAGTYVMKSIEAVTRSSDLLRKIITLSKSQKDPESTRIQNVFISIDKAVNMVSMEYPSREIRGIRDPPTGEVLAICDDLLDDLFRIIFHGLVKSNGSDRVDIGINHREWSYDGVEGSLITITDEIQEISGEIGNDLMGEDRILNGSSYSMLDVTITRNIAARYGGRVWIHEKVEEEGRSGSTYMIFLPGIKEV